MSLKFTVCIFIALLFACNNSSKESKPSESLSKKMESPLETQQMMDSIKKIKERINFRNHPYESAEKLKRVEKEINLAKTNNQVGIPLYIEYFLMQAERKKP